MLDIWLPGVCLPEQPKIKGCRDVFSFSKEGHIVLASKNLSVYGSIFKGTSRHYTGAALPIVQLVKMRIHLAPPHIWKPTDNSLGLKRPVASRPGQVTNESCKPSLFLDLTWVAYNNLPLTKRPSCVTERTDRALYLIS